MPHQSPKRNHQRWISYAFLLLNTVVWGAAFVIIKPAFAITTPYRFLLYRFLIASLLTLPLLWHYRAYFHPRWWPSLAKITGIELIGTTLALALVYEGLKLTTALEANLIVTTLPLFITLGGVLLLKEKQEGHEWFGLFLSLSATVWLVVIPQHLSDSPTYFRNMLTQTSLLGNILVFGHNLVNIFYFPLAKKYYHQLPKLFASTISFWVGLISFAVLSWWELGWSVGEVISVSRFELTQPSVWIASGYMAIFGSIIGLTAYFKGQDGIEASEATLFQYLQPLVYIPLAFVVDGDLITFNQLMALLVIVGGVVIAEQRFSLRRFIFRRFSLTSRLRS